ncbi:flavin reductase family protein [Novosphingobium terrae]|uniref:flavin reductase family protein n=1 Tax=Novosphingobium terrae TaxID=2726189 RepID=UPI001F13E288|nr:flavin reductase family protein [Novosphingobium terrae]
MNFDLAAMGAKPRYNLLTALVVPRPIAWVTSRNASGQLNVAPFSFFNLMSGNPPVLCLGVGARDGIPKDTARNILETSDFVVNLVSEACLPAMNATAIDFPPQVDEAQEAGLALEDCIHIDVPRLAISPVALECRLMQAVPFGVGRNILIADILSAHVRNDAVLNAERGHIDAFALEMVGRMHGGGWYARARDGFRLPRLKEEDWRSQASVQSPEQGTLPD